MTSAYYRNNYLSAIHEYKSLYNMTIPQTSQFLIERVHRPTYSAGRKHLQSNVNSLYSYSVFHVFSFASGYSYEYNKGTDRQLSSETLQLTDLPPNSLLSVTQASWIDSPCGHMIFSEKREQSRTASFSSSLLLRWIRCNMKLHI